MALAVTHEHVRKGEEIFRAIAISLKDFMLYGDSHPHESRSTPSPKRLS